MGKLRQIFCKHDYSYHDFYAEKNDDDMFYHSVRVYKCLYCGKEEHIDTRKEDWIQAQMYQKMQKIFSEINI